VTIEQLLGDVAAAGEEFARFVEGLPAEVVHRRPGGEEWSVAEISGHVAESPLFHATTVRRLLDDPQTTFGRPRDDAQRLAAVASLASAAPAEVAAAVRRTFGEVMTILRALPSDAWQARGRLHNGEERTVAQTVETSVVEHVRDHLKQARAVVAALTP
jgi:hypothetical protein